MGPHKCLIFILCLNFVVCFSKFNDKKFHVLKLVNGRRVVKIGSSLDLTSNDWLSYAYIDHSINETGWVTLEIVANPELKDEDQVYEGGFLEGKLTTQYIYQHWVNTWKDYCSDKQATCDTVTKFLKTNSKWIKNQYKSHGNQDPYWHHVGLFFRQMEGLIAGYQNAAGKDKEIPQHDMFMMNMKWDVETLVSALEKGDEQKEIFIPGSCSAIIKVLPNFSDLLVAHNTWTKYNDMLRIMKMYNFTLHVSPTSKALAPGRTMSFTSYPGAIISGDDFYILSSGLVTMETTNDLKNRSLYNYISPDEQVMSAIRSTVANRLANSGEEWTNLFGKFNSGTYNNQWMIIDYKRFTPRRHLSPGTLWISEQMPGAIMAKDVTPVLGERGYWGSYNIPSIEYIYNISGLREWALKYGNWYTHDKSPRAKMFERDHMKVKNVETLLKLMRYNDYLNDPLSRCDKCKPKENACNAIASRCELNPVDGSYPFHSLEHRMHGAIDAKVTNSSMQRDLELLAVSGPTPGHDLPKFQWSALRKEDQLSHLGIPDLPDFQPILHNWESLNHSK